MPRQKTRQAPFATIPLIGPGFKGLNTEIASVVGSIDPLWATDLENAVFDNKGRIALRKGWIDQTTTPMTNAPDVHVTHEFVRQDQTTSLVTATLRAGPTVELWHSTDSGDTWTDVSGALTSTTAKWKFVNFNDELLATAPGHKVWKFTGTGTFTEITDSPVTNGTLLAAFGRLWAGVDGTSAFQYSNLLDADDWTGTGAGTVDAENAWTQGTDNITAIEAFGATLVIFGKRHILIYVDGTGSTLGIDPDNMYVVDTIEGTGTLHRDSVVRIGEGDIWYLSPQGVQSLTRAIQDKVNPLADITRNVRALVQDLTAAHVGSEGTIQAIFDPTDQFVLYLFPESDRAILLDTKFALEGGERRAAEWTGLTSFFSLAATRDGNILFGLGGGNIALYDGYRDDGGGADTIYDLVYASPWMDGGPEAHNRIKILKQIYGIFYGRETLTATARWSFDFRPLEFVETFTNDFLSSGGEWGVGEFGEAEYGTGHRLRRQYVGGMGDGQFVKIWITIGSTDVDAIVALQEMGMHIKLGRAI